MALTLTELHSRVSQMLMDISEDIWPAAVLDESIRQALAAYSLAFPSLAEATIPLPASGDIDLSSLPGLADVIAVRWPFEDGKTEILQPINRVTGWRCWRDLDKPTLELRTVTGCSPAAGDVVRLRYTTGHAVNGLDGAETSTIPLAHCALLVCGAAGYAALFRAIDKVENRSYGSRRTEPSLLQNWGEALLDRFNRYLDALRKQRLPAGGRTRWRMDQWDSR
jgi:hypothetical protein